MFKRRSTPPHVTTNTDAPSSPASHATPSTTSLPSTPQDAASGNNDPTKEKEETPFLGASVNVVIALFSLVAGVGTTLYPYGLFVLHRQYMVVEHLDDAQSWQAVTLLPAQIVGIHAALALVSGVALASVAILFFLIAISTGIEWLSDHTTVFKRRLWLKAMAYLLLILVLSFVAGLLLRGGPSFTLQAYGLIVTLLTVSSYNIRRILDRIHDQQNAKEPISPSSKATFTASIFWTLFFVYPAGQFYAYTVLSTESHIMPIYTLRSTTQGTVTGEVITSANGAWYVVATDRRHGRLLILPTGDIRSIRAQ